jgi:hypothetical protein
MGRGRWPARKNTSHVGNRGYCVPCEDVAAARGRAVGLASCVVRWLKKGEPMPAWIFPSPELQPDATPAQPERRESTERKSFVLNGDQDFHQLEPDGELAKPAPGAPRSRIVKRAGVYESLPAEWG